MKQQPEKAVSNQPTQRKTEEMMEYAKEYTKQHALTNIPQSWTTQGSTGAPTWTITTTNSPGNICYTASNLGLQ